MAKKVKPAARKPAAKKPVVQEPISDQAEAAPPTILERARQAAGEAYLSTFWQIVRTDDPDLLNLVLSTRQREATAEFLLQDRTVPAEAIAINLALKNLGGSMAPRPLEVILWTAFRTVFFLVLDHLELQEQERIAASAPPAPGFTAANRDLALMPEPDAFAPTGFSPRR